MPRLQWKQLSILVKSTASEWNEHKAPRLGAALAYYALLSLAPLLVLVVAIFGLVFDQTTAQQRLLAQVHELLGGPAAQSLRSVLASAHSPSRGIVAGAIALATLLFGASGVFTELRDSLNTIWDAPPSGLSNLKSMIWQRLISFAMVLSLGFLLLASLLLSTGLALLSKFFEKYVPLRAALYGEVLNFVVPLIALSVLFALVYKFVPDVYVSWRDVVIGAVVSAIFFAIGKELLTIYFATAAVGSTYGAAGSLVAFVVWVYYSAQIFFFGAMFTRCYARMFGSQAKQKHTVLKHTQPAVPPASHSASA